MADAAPVQAVATAEQATVYKPPKLHRPGENMHPPSTCIFGPQGVGKTSLLATLPGSGFVAETPTMEGQGDAVLQNYRDRITATNVETWDEIESVYWYLRADQEEAKRNGATRNNTGATIGGIKYRWASLDTVTGMKTLAIRKVVGERRAELAMKPHKITTSEWGDIGQLLSELVYKFTTLWMTFVYTAQEKIYTTEDERGGKVMKIGPDMTPGSVGSILPVCWVVGRMVTLPNGQGGWERKLYTGPNARYMTKARTVSADIELPQAVLNPNLYHLLNYLYGRTGPEAEIEIANESTMGIDNLGLEIS